ncbi:MAG: helix-turn-helix domain-containing protein [Bacteroidales bacterium]|mgnify:CR=1 FL=1|nr:helix-turn-helix domain-containing protein [Bacteroidales bacterium]
MTNEILLNGISFNDFQNSIQTIVSNEVQKAVEQLTPPESTDTTPELLTRKQTAEYLGVSLPTLHKWTKKGIIPAKRIGSLIRYEKNIICDTMKDVETLKYRRV